MDKHILLVITILILFKGQITIEFVIGREGTMGCCKLYYPQSLQINVKIINKITHYVFKNHWLKSLVTDDENQQINI